MAPDFFADLTLIDVHRDVNRNIVSLRVSRNLFDDLSDDPGEQELAQRIETAVKPALYRSPTPAIDRPFEEAEWFNAIGWPFRHWQGSRYSDGSYGAWYGADSVETTVYETAYHWYHGLLADAEGFADAKVAVERKVYDVACDALLVDVRPRAEAYPALVHSTHLAFARQVGARLQREGHPGLVAPSVRRAGGSCYVVFNPVVLARPRVNCMMTYRLDGKHIRVEKRRGRAWFTVAVDELEGSRAKDG